MKSIFQNILYTLKLSCTLVGTVVGAGFLSGTELVRFFSKDGYFGWLMLSAFLFALFFYLLYTCGMRCGGFSGVVENLFGRLSKAVLWTLLVGAFVMCSGMLAGLDAAAREGLGWNSWFPICSLAVLPFLYTIGKRGVGGLFWVNFALVPLLAVFVFFHMGHVPRSAFWSENAVFWKSFLNVVFYVSLNCFLAAPIVCDAGASRQSGGIGCVLAAIIIGVLALIILCCISQFGKDAYRAQMPFLYGLKGTEKILFSLACIAGILTTLFSSWYPIYEAVCQKRHAVLMRCAVVLFFIFLLSLSGLKSLVQFIYPVVGGIGAIFLSVCAWRGRSFFDENLFRKSHNRVHARGKNTQYGGCRHH